MATIKDVAKKAGVSHGTVSNVLNGYTNVKIESVKKVELAIKELGYRQDRKAKSLKTNTSMNVGVIMPNISDRHYAQIYQGVQRALHSQGYSSFLHLTSDILAIEDNEIDLLLQQRMDGMVIISCRKDYTSLLKRLGSENTKTVFIEREPIAHTVNFVGTDCYKTINHKVQQLLKSNITKIALLTGQEYFSDENACIEGYVNAHTQYGIRQINGFVRSTNLNKESAFREAMRLLQLGELPDVIMTSSMFMMEGVIKALKLNGDQSQITPKLISLAESSWSGHIVSQVETISRKSIEIGYESARILVENMKSPQFFEEKRLSFDTVEAEELFKEDKVSDKQIDNETIKVLMLKSTSGYATHSLLPDFKAKFGINIEITFLEYGDMYNEIKKHSDDGYYDVVQYDVPWVQDLAKSGDIMPLNNYIDDIEKVKSSYLDGLFDLYGVYENDIYGFPYMYGIQLLYYRKDLFEDLQNKRRFYEIYKTDLLPPKTWSEFNAVAKFFTQAFNDESPVAYGTTLGARYSSGGICEYLPRQWAYGGLTFKDRKVELDSKENVRAIENYKESFKYAPSTAPRDWWDEQVAYFSDGKAAMMIMFNSHATDIIDPSKSLVAGNIGYDVIPGGKPLVGGWGLGLTSSGKNIDNALKFVRWACGDEIALAHTILGGTSGKKELYNNGELLQIYPWLLIAKDSLFKGYKREMPLGLHGGIIPEREFEKILGKSIFEVVSDENTATESLRAAKEKLQHLIDSH